MDQTDRQILRLLQEDGRRSYKELGHLVGLAPSTVHGRVQRLREEGVLRGVRADIDDAALGITLQAMVFVELQTQAAAASLGFRETATTWPEVRALYEVAGRFDYLLHVAARDTDHLRSFRNGRLAIHDSVRSIETALIFDHWRAPLAPDWASAATETGN